MPIPNYEHLFDQARRLSAPPAAGPPLQVDLRRAISAAYYGVFHFTLTRLADAFVGVSQRQTARYALVYRSVDHRVLRDVAAEVQKASPSRRFVPYIPTGGFDTGLQAFAVAVIDLQEKRHRADYSPLARFRSADAQITIDTARSAIQRFERSDPESRNVFLTLLLCPPR